MTNTKLLETISRYIEVTNEIPYKYIHGLEIFLILFCILCGVALLYFIHESRVFFSRIMSLGVADAYLNTRDEENIRKKTELVSSVSLRARLTWAILLSIVGITMFTSLILSGRTSDKIKDITVELTQEIENDITENYITKSDVLEKAFKPLEVTKPENMGLGGTYKISFIYEDEYYSDKVILLTYNKSLPSNLLIPFEDKGKYKGLSGMGYSKDFRYSKYFDRNSVSSYYSSSSINMEDIDYIYNLNVK